MVTENGTQRSPSNSADGVYRAVPIDIHRINSLFYNGEVVEEAGADPTALSSPASLLDAFERVEDETDAAGIIQPLKDPWPTLQLWETVLLAEAGERVYEAVIDGESRSYRDAVEDALATTASFLEFTSDDALFLAHTDTNQCFVDGEAAFFYQGDWTARAYGDVPEFAYQDWGHVAFPGTDGLFAMNMARCWSRQMPSRTREFSDSSSTSRPSEGMKRFNKHKSTPSRTDVPLDEFPTFLQAQHRDFERSRSQLSSIIHGLGIEPDVLIELKTAISTFLQDRDTTETAREMVDALAEN